MVKKVWIAVFFILTFFGQVAWADNLPDLQKIIEKKKIVVALVNQENEPFSMKDKNGQLFGLDIELAKRIGKELGVNVEFLQTAKSFDEVIEQISEKKADVAISELTSNPRRAQFVAFTKPYVSLNLAVLMNRVKNFEL